MIESKNIRSLKYNLRDKIERQLEEGTLDIDSLLNEYIEYFLKKHNVSSIDELSTAEKKKLKNFCLRRKLEHHVKNEPGSLDEYIYDRVGWWPTKKESFDMLIKYTEEQNKEIIEHDKRTKVMFG